MVMDDMMRAKEDELHPIQVLMKDFYRVTDKLSRPRIFGVVTIPRSALVIFDIGFLRLENILDAKYHGITDAVRDSILSSPDKPMELVVYYDAQVQVDDTPLLKNLLKFDPHMSIFRHHFRNSRHALGEIGACACDLVWRRALKEMDAEPGYDHLVFEEDDELQAGSDAAVKKAKNNIRNVIRNWMFTMPNLDRTSRGFNITPKFAKLMQILKACEPQGDAFRGIIFGIRYLSSNSGAC